jgi:hypothetical protein
MSDPRYRAYVMSTRTLDNRVLGKATKPCPHGAEGLHFWAGWCVVRCLFCGERLR